MTTLGERLKAREAREEADKMAKLDRESRQRGEKAMADLRAVQQYFDSAREDITEDISNDLPVREITLGKRGDDSAGVASILQTYSWNYNIHQPGRSIEYPQHAYYAVWEGFQQWANAEGLEVKFTYDYDGGGIESWHVLKVKVLA